MAREPKGKLNLRWTDDMRDRCQQVADLSGLSLNAFILKAIDNYLPYAERGVRYQLKEAVKRQREMDEARQLAARIPKVAANQKCPCLSGKKYKHCHGQMAEV